MKILLANDYNVTLGGIEQYVQDVSSLLHSEGHEIMILGLQLSLSLLHRIRSLLLPIVSCNIIFSLQMIYTIISYKPSLIWRNSVTRYIGWLPLMVASCFRVRSWMMYHDMGYFHPYPSRLYSLDQIPKQRTMRDWLLSGYQVKGNSYVITLLLVFKYISNSLIRQVAKKHVEKHLVPSRFMANILHDQWGIPHDSIVVLPHFGRIEKN